MISRPLRSSGLDCAAVLVSCGDKQSEFPGSDTAPRGCSSWQHILDDAIKQTQAEAKENLLALLLPLMLSPSHPHRRALGVFLKHVCCSSPMRIACLSQALSCFACVAQTLPLGSVHFIATVVCVCCFVVGGDPGFGLSPVLRHTDYPGL